MTILCIHSFRARLGVKILAAIFQAALPAPALAAAGAEYELAARVIPTCKDVVTRRVLETPAVAPRALLRVSAHFFILVHALNNVSVT